MQKKKRFKNEHDNDTIIMPIGNETENISKNLSLPCVTKNVNSKPSHVDVPTKRSVIKIESIITLVSIFIWSSSFKRKA